MINGQVFDWESIKIDTIWGLDLQVLGISYKSSRPSKAVYGRGNAPRGFGRTNLEQTGSIELPANSFLQLSAYAATQGGILRIPPFVITVSYANADQTTQVDVLDAVVFDDIDTGAKQGDEEVAKRTLSINILNPIKYSGVPVM